MLDNTLYFANRWKLLSKSKTVPDMFSASKRTIDLTLKSSDFGISFDDFDLELPGTPIDLTDYTVKVRCLSLPYPPSLVESSEGYTWQNSYTLFTNTCTITDAANGVCQLSISRNDSDYVGQVICQIFTEDGSGNKRIVGSFTFNFLENYFSVSE